jgi:hypothetical protein
VHTRSADHGQASIGQGRRPLARMGATTKMPTNPGCRRKTRPWRRAHTQQEKPILALETKRSNRNLTAPERTENQRTKRQGQAGNRCTDRKLRMELCSTLARVDREAKNGAGRTNRTRAPETNRDVEQTRNSMRTETTPKSTHTLAGSSWSMQKESHCCTCWSY